LGCQLALAQEWQLVWSDEFHGSIGPDWVYDIGNGGAWGNNEMEYYRRENATVENDALVITAKREDVGGYRYTSARMKTQGRKGFKYGKIEARIALPARLGLWPAFWMLGTNLNQVGWPASGEIDIMEQINTETQRVRHGALGRGQRRAGVQGRRDDDRRDQLPRLRIEWDASAIKWFVDGQQYHVQDITNGVGSTEEFHKEFFLLLNLAVGGDWPASTSTTNALPAKMYVDYVRVYQRGAAPAARRRLPPPPPPPPAASASASAPGLDPDRGRELGRDVGVQTEVCTEGGLNVGWIDTDDWIVWNVNVPASGTYTSSTASRASTAAAGSSSRRRAAARLTAPSTCRRPAAGRSGPRVAPGQADGRRAADRDQRAQGRLQPELAQAHCGDGATDCARPV
jgi:hypothetical protein